MLFRGAEAQHVLYARAVVPTSVKNHDFALGREMLNVALYVHLRLLAVGRRRQCHHPENARTEFFGERSDRPTFSGSVSRLLLSLSLSFVARATGVGC